MQGNNKLRCRINETKSQPKQFSIKIAICIIENLYKDKNTHQIQGQIGIYGINKRDHMIYTSKGIYVTTVDFDHLFRLADKKMHLNYREYLLPNVISIQKT